VILRPAEPRDHAAIRGLVETAFKTADHASGTEQDIVEGVRAENAVLVELVAEEDGQVVGHVLFSRMTCVPDRFFAALGPVAVAPGRQKSGIGGDLIREGLARCRALGADGSIVLGHPDYYPRFGYSAEATANIDSPYRGAGPAFMALALTPGALDQPLKADYPAAFD
jgi:putative acetyltransferase